MTGRRGLAAWTLLVLATAWSGAAGPRTAEERKLLERRRAVLERLVEFEQAAYEQGRERLDRVVDARLELLEAELELAEGPAQRVAIRARMVAMLEKLEEGCRRRSEAGLATSADLYRAQAARLAAQVALLRERRAGGGPEAGRAIVVDKTKLSSLYPAVWFSPSTGEIAPLTQRSETPPEPKYEIWIEPRDPEFGYNPEHKPGGVGFALLGRGREVFQNPKLPAQPKLDLKLTHLMKESQGSDGLVFYCKGKAGDCLLMVTAMSSKEQVVRFTWRPLRKEP